MQSRTRTKIGFAIRKVEFDFKLLEKFETKHIHLRGKRTSSPSTLTFTQISYSSAYGNRINSSSDGAARAGAVIDDP